MKFDPPREGIDIRYRHLRDDNRHFVNITVDHMRCTGKYIVTVDASTYCVEGTPHGAVRYVDVGPEFATETEAMAYAVAFYYMMKGKEVQNGT